MVTDDRPVLIVDCANLFIRCWAAFPQMSAHGYQMGGCIGFLKTLRRMVADNQPSAVYMCWEAGGSQKRRALFKEYKMNRRPEKLNRFYEQDIPDSDDNRKHQMIALLAMLKCAPVCHVYVPDCEGDDEVAYLCKGPLHDKNRIIASSDKDMYQLLDDTTRVYSLHKKIFVTQHHVLDEYRVRSSNFAIAKALCGDKGDNVPGVKGIGFKKVAGLFPFLGTDETVLLEDVFNYCHTHLDESKQYQRILDAREDVVRAYRLVYLDGGMLAASQQAKVSAALQAFIPRSDRIGMIRELVKEGIGDFDVEGFMYTFNCIDGMTNARGDK